MAELQPGQTFSHYKIIGTLARGGQSTAYKAEDLRLHRPVVIKIIRPDLATGAPRQRFEREARLASALDHPSICTIYDIGEADGLCYIVMQFLEGQTLKQLMAGRSLETLGALSIAVQVADALATAHARGIVHRDVKPSNVIVNAAGQARLVDFGLAKMLASDEPEAREPDADDVTKLGVPYGTPSYGSPEQASGKPVDHRTDIFSLGVLIYEMVTGRRPFTGRQRIDVLHAVINATPRPITELNPQAPREVQAILDRALAKEPRDRVPTMAAMRDELKALRQRLSPEPDVVPVEVSTALTPERAHRSWVLGGVFGRVFGRGRSTAPPSDPTGAARARSSSSRTETKRAIAVLPFKNLTGDVEADFYESSLADGIISELAQIRSLVVRPLSYVAQYAGRNVDPRQAGDELAASAVVVGSFIKTPDRFRVAAQLIATATGEILWSDKIDVAARDLITIQDTIAERLIAGLRLRLTAEDRERIGQRLTDSAEAYESYLRGRARLFQYVTRTFDDRDLDAAIKMFGEAIRLDPQFARAYASLGRCYVHRAQGSGGHPYYQFAAGSLRRALELDPTLTGARLQMVYVFLHYGDRDRAHATITRLWEEAPDDAGVLLVAGMLYRLDGLYDKALEAYDRLFEINPRDIVLASAHRARIYTHQRQYERAIAELERARAVAPDHPLVKAFLAVAYFYQGRIDEAQALVEGVLSQQPNLDGLQSVLGWCLNARGEHERARALVTDRVKETAAADHDFAFWLASFYAMEGLADDAIEWVRRAIRLGNQNYPLFADNPKLENLRADPRFVDILEELKRRWEARRSPGASPGTAGGRAANRS